MSIADESRQWVLMDYLNRNQSGLISIGCDRYHGASLRKNLTALGRELLVDRIRLVSETSVPIDEKVAYRGEVYRVIVEPLLSPATATLMAVQGIFFPAGEEPPARPVVGSKEWDIWDDGRIATTWDEGVFRLYEIPYADFTPARSLNEWIASLIAPEDRARIKMASDTVIGQSSGKRHFTHYRIVTRSSTGNPGRKTIRSSAICTKDPALPMRKLLLYSWEEPDVAPALDPERGDTGGLLSAIFELSTDAVLAAVDTRRWQTFMASSSWGAFGLQEPPYGYLPHIIHPDDFNIFRDTVQSDGVDAVPVRFLHVSGDYRTYDVSASSGQVAASVADYAICRIKERPRV